MTTPATQIDARGRTTVPQEVRDRLGTGPGDDLLWVEQPDHSYLVVSRAHLIRCARGSWSGSSTSVDDFLQERRDAAMETA